MNGPIGAANGNHPLDRLPLYLLDDLPSIEMREIERHLRTCRTCADDLARLQETFVAAVEGLPQTEVPAVAWDRIEASVEARTRSRAAIEDTGVARRAAPPPGPRRAPPRAVDRSRGARRPAWTVALTASLLAAALGGWGAWQRQGRLVAEADLATTLATLRGMSQNQELVADYLTEEDVTVRTMTRAEAAAAEAAASGSALFLPDGRALVVMRDVPAVGRDFQAWGIRGDEVVSLGAFQGRTTEVPVEDFETLAVSLEPDGGSEVPTEVLVTVSTS